MFIAEPPISWIDKKHTYKRNKKKTKLLIKSNRINSFWFVQTWTWRLWCPLRICVRLRLSIERGTICELTKNVNWCIWWTELRYCKSISCSAATMANWRDAREPEFPDAIQAKLCVWAVAAVVWQPKENSQYKKYLLDRHLIIINWKRIVAANAKTTMTTMATRMDRRSEIRRRRLVVSARIIRSYILKINSCVLSRHGESNRIAVIAEKQIRTETECNKRNKHWKKRWKKNRNARVCQSRSNARNYTL